MSRARRLLLVLALFVGGLVFTLGATFGVVWLDLYARPAVKAWWGGF